MCSCSVRTRFGGSKDLVKERQRYLSAGCLSLFPVVSEGVRVHGERAGSFLFFVFYPLSFRFSFPFYLLVKTPGS